MKSFGKGSGDKKQAPVQGPKGKGGLPQEMLKSMGRNKARVAFQKRGR